MDYFRHFWDPHWFTPIGLIITLLGVLYTSGNYLDKKYTSLKLIAHAFTFGILGAIISFLNDFLFNLIQRDFGNFDITAIPFGFGFGLAVFVVYILLKRYRKNNSLFIVIICVSLLINAFVSNISNLYLNAKILSYSLAYISSFILGLFTASLSISMWKKTVYGFLIICSILAMLILLNILLKVAKSGIITHEYIYVTGFIVGNVLYDAERVQTNSQINAWKPFIFWLLVGCLAPLMLFLPVSLYNKELALLFYAFCASNAQGDKIIKQFKIRYKYVTNWNRIQPLINWGRFKYSLIISIIYILPLCFLYFLLLYKIDSYIFRWAFIFASIALFSKIYIVISLVYGFGNAIVYNIENLSERRLGQIGVILTISGILIATFH